MATVAGSGSVDHAVAARFGAVAVALWWIGAFFGAVDLSVVIGPLDPEYADTPLISASWGLLYAVLIPVPLLAWAARPNRWTGPQVVAIGVVGVGFGVVQAWRILDADRAGAIDDVTLGLEHLPMQAGFVVAAPVAAAVAVLTSRTGSRAHGSPSSHRPCARSGSARFRCATRTSREVSG